MTPQTELARDAVRRFATQIAGRAGPDRICVRLHGADGMAGLCAAEAAILELWPASTAKELIWLTRMEAAETLQVQAFSGGALLAEATYELGLADA